MVLLCLLLLEKVTERQRWDRAQYLLGSPLGVALCTLFFPKCITCLPIYFSNFHNVCTSLHQVLPGDAEASGQVQVGSLFAVWLQKAPTGVRKDNECRKVVHERENLSNVAV